MTYILVCYSVYLVLTVILTVWVARTLFRNGKVFLIDIFHGNEDKNKKHQTLLQV